MSTKNRRNITLGLLGMCYIVLRCLADFIAFLLPGSVDTARSMGWPVNSFWESTTLPVVFALLGLSVYGLWEIIFKGHINLISTFVLVTITVNWSITLIMIYGDTVYMVIDGISWLAVAIIAICLSNIVTKK